MQRKSGMNANSDNRVETVVAEKQGRFGTVQILRSEFDVVYRIGDGPWQTERQTSWQVTGPGQNRLGTTEANARARFNRA